MSPRNRPLSPHLQVYHLPMLARLSISHRITGVGLLGGLVLLAWWLGAAAAGPESFAFAQAVLGSFLGRLVLLGFTAALFYHLANGVRHLAWDAGMGYEIKQAYASGRAVLVITVVMTAIVWLAALA
jgi:succinate dehydrogenase / fumarate reductase, cytochrome b subunit